MATDTTEKRLEALIVADMTGRAGDGAPVMGGEIRDAQAPYGGAGYAEGDPADYDREHAVDLVKLLKFLDNTQPKVVESLGISGEGPRRQQFLHRLQGEIAKRGIIDVLRGGIRHGPEFVELFYATPTPGNIKADELFNANIFSVTRQLRYSRDETQLSLDMAIFINGLPFATFELKNNLT